MAASVTDRVKVLPRAPGELGGALTHDAVTALTDITAAAIDGSLSTDRARYGVELLREFTSCWAAAAETHGVASSEAPEPPTGLQGRELAIATLRKAASAAHQGNLTPRVAEDAALVLAEFTTEPASSAPLQHSDADEAPLHGAGCSCGAHGVCTHFDSHERKTMPQDNDVQEALEQAEERRARRERDEERATAYLKPVGISILAPDDVARASASVIAKRRSDARDSDELRSLRSAAPEAPADEDGGRTCVSCELSFDGKECPGCGGPGKTAAQREHLRRRALETAWKRPLKVGFSKGGGDAA